MPTTWKELFSRWPPEMTRRGVVIASFGEQVAFSGFAAGETFLLLERQSPDAMGARTIFLRYDEILGLKLLDVLKAKSYQSFGFEMPAAR